MHRGQLFAIAALLLLAAGFCGCLGSDSSDDGDEKSPYWDLEQATFNSINAHRASIGLAKLNWSGVMAGQARGHSEAMADGRVNFSHDGFQDRVDAIKKEISIGGAGENVAMNWGSADPVGVAVSGWLNSTGHKANIEGDYDLTGVGVAKSSDGKYYLTQMFVKSG